MPVYIIINIYSGPKLTGTLRYIKVFNNFKTIFIFIAKISTAISLILLFLLPQISSSIRIESIEKFPTLNLLSLKDNFFNNRSFVALRKRLFKGFISNSTEIYFFILIDIAAI